MNWHFIRYRVATEVKSTLIKITITTQNHEIQRRHYEIRNVYPNTEIV